MNKNALSHIAFILDGNNRWAKKNKLPTISGYKKGFEKIIDIVEYSNRINLSSLTLFTLSSENFNRPSINIIYEIIYSNFSKLFDQLISKKNIKINIIGSKENLPQKILNIFDQVEKITTSNTILNLNLAFNYGFKYEIKDVLNKFKKNLNDINLNNDIEIRNLFYLGKQSDPDILIRTGGYNRLSNFLMYNLTYTELFFTDTLWPDLTNKEIDLIINKYKKLDRKYGL